MGSLLPSRIRTTIFGVVKDMLTAQELYDERERNALISGTDLHDLFRLLCDGEPSPSGRTEIDRKKIMEVQSRFHPQSPDFRFLQVILDDSSIAE